MAQIKVEKIDKNVFLANDIYYFTIHANSDEGVNITAKYILEKELDIVSVIRKKCNKLVVNKFERLFYQINITYYELMDNSIFYISKA